MHNCYKAIIPREQFPPDVKTANVTRKSLTCYEDVGCYVRVGRVTSIPRGCYEETASAEFSPYASTFIYLVTCMKIIYRDRGRRRNRSRAGRHIVRWRRRIRPDSERTRCDRRCGRCTACWKCSTPPPDLRHNTHRAVTTELNILSRVNTSN